MLHLQRYKLLIWIQYRMTKNRMGSRRNSTTENTASEFADTFVGLKVKVKVAQSCLTLCDTLDRSPPGPSAHGISQARILEWVAISSFRRSSWPRDQTHVRCWAGGFFTAEPSGKSQHVNYISLKLSLKNIMAAWTLGDTSACKVTFEFSA